MGRLKRIKKYIVRQLSRMVRWPLRRRIQRKPVTKGERSHLPSIQLHCKKEMLPVTNIFCKEDAQPDEYIKDKHDWSYEKVSERKTEERDWKKCADLPINMKGAQAVFFNDHLYIGGGYTGCSANDSTVFRFHPPSNNWEQLPTCPVKWFGMAVFNQQLVLVGGREIGSRKYKSSNRIVSWNEVNQSWAFSLPPMTFARASPIVFGYHGYLVVAGGEKGSLDYCVEVLDPVAKRWVIAPSLPATCSPLTSAVSGDSWYLLHDNCLLSADIEEIVLQAMASSECQDKLPLQEAVNNHLKKKQQIDLSMSSKSNSDLLWRRLSLGQTGEIIQVTTVGDDLFIMIIRDGCTNLCKLKGDLQWETVATCERREDVKQMVIEGAGNGCLFLLEQTEPGIVKMYVHE